MHELSLYAQVPVDHLALVLNILTGLAGMQGTASTTLTSIFAPVKPANDTNVISKKIPSKAPLATSAQLAYVQVERDLSTITNTIQDDPQVTIRSMEIPEPETKHLVLRRANEEQMALTAATTRYSDTSKFTFVRDFTTQSQRFIHKDVILQLYRTLCFKPEQIISANAGHSQSFLSAPADSLPRFEDMALLDGSGAFVLQASVRIEDRTKPALVQAATEQLLALKNELRGAIELSVPERLALDTRVRV